MKRKTLQNNVRIMKNTTKQCKNNEKTPQNNVRIMKKHHNAM
jgi:hypothetical protein